MVSQNLQARRTMHSTSDFIDNLETAICFIISVILTISVPYWSLILHLVCHSCYKKYWLYSGDSSIQRFIAQQNHCIILNLTLKMIVLMTQLMWHCYSIKHCSRHVPQVYITLVVEMGLYKYLMLALFNQCI